ncbi:hypothetical protein [Brevibacillus borstelensis]|uniref:hypothetical protein n=1 Tax=Brevibacillus borstelensis TaxID=45462 RepID=UPI0030C418B1
MDQIGSRVYFDKVTGDVLVKTAERSGVVHETTVDEDFTRYTALAERVRETVDYIQLEYGQYAQDFAECNGYRVNPETRTIEFSYPDPNAPEETPVYRKSLSEENEELREQLAATNRDLQDIAEHVFGA